MALTERERGRLRSALEAVIRAEDAVAEVADGRARTPNPALDAELDAAEALLRELILILERLLTR